MINVLELFAGNADITKAFQEHCHAMSLDINPAYLPDLVGDAYKLEPRVLKCFDFIWLSPDCTTYSLASHGKHRIKGGIPVSDYAKECDTNNRQLINLLIDLNIPFIIENPRCHFRHMDFVQGLNRVTVYYSTYGAEYTKPTDLFSNRDITRFFNQTITRGEKNLDYVKMPTDFLGRCKIPDLLISDIVNAGLTLAKEK